MRIRTISMVAASTLAAAACATARAPATAPPSLVPDPGIPASATARLYAACVGQAISAQTLDQERNRIRFHCDGQPAAALNAALLTWATRGGASMVSNGTRFNMSTPIEHDLYGVDYCTSVAYNGDSARCTISLNVGDLLSAP